MIICHILVIIVLTEIAFTQKKYVELNINKNQLGLPIVTFCDKHQLLIDTGSEEVWMADNSCSQCYQTLSLCPYITELKKEISYFKGKVKGDYIYLKTCFGQQHKIICAKELEDMNNIQAHGIVGIRGGSTGNNFIKQFMNDNNIQGNSVTVYYGMNEGKVFLGEVPDIYRKEDFVIGDNKNWSLTAEKVIIAGIKQIDINCSVHFDTGSNIIILESSLYNAIIQQIASLMSQQGCYKLSPLSYKCYNSFISINQSLAFTFKGSTQNFHINLQHLINIQDTIFTFMLDRTDKNICILGVPAFRNYLIQFQMNGHLKIYHSNRPLLTQIEYSNYIYMLLQYVLLVVVLAVVSVRVARLIDEKINRKIVI